MNDKHIEAATAANHLWKADPQGHPFCCECGVRAYTEEGASACLAKRASLAAEGEDGLIEAMYRAWRSLTCFTDDERLRAALAVIRASDGARVATLLKDIEANEAYQSKLCDMLSAEAARAEAAEARVKELEFMEGEYQRHLSDARRDLAIMWGYTDWDAMIRAGQGCDEKKARWYAERINGAISCEARERALRDAMEGAPHAPGCIAIQFANRGQIRWTNGECDCFKRALQEINS